MLLKLGNFYGNESKLIKNEKKKNVCIRRVCGHIRGVKVSCGVLHYFTVPKITFKTNNVKKITLKGFPFLTKIGFTY